jgi:hypothetical protein
VKTEKTVACKKGGSMKKVTVILLIIMGVVILLGSVSNSWAGDNKVFFHFVLIFDDNGNITGVDALNPKTGGLMKVQERKEPIQDIVGTATLHWLRGDDPCVVIGGKKYCW